MNGYMNKNRNSIKGTFSNIRPSDECIERVLNMTKDNKNTKRIKFAPALAIVACMAILVTGIFGSGAVNGRTKVADALPSTTQATAPSNNFFTITAYAEEGGEKIPTELKDDKVVLQDYRIWRQYDADGALELHGSGKSGFSVSGENIKSVTYSCKTGIIRFSVDINKVNYLIKEGKYYDVILPYLDEYKNIKGSQRWEVFAEHFEKGDYDEYFKEVGKKKLEDYYIVREVYNDDDTEVIGIGVLSNETWKTVSDKGWMKEYTFENYFNTTEAFAEVYWELDDTQAEKLLRDTNMGYEEIPYDTLTITVEFNDGSKQVASYDLGFNADGNLVIQKLK